MRPRLPVVPFAIVLALACQALGAQEKKDPPVDPALPDHLKELRSMVADPKASEDFRAIGLVQKLATKPAERNPKDHDRIAKALGDVFRTGKARPADRDHLYRETADALALFGAAGAKELAKAFADDRIEDSLSLRAHVLLALGRTEDEKQVPLLVDEAVNSPHDELRAAAGEALGSYTSLDAKPRRDTVKDLIRAWGSLHSKATTADSNDPNAPIDFEPQNARKTLRAVEAKWNATLNRLTGVSNSTFPEWQRWLNKNQSWPMPPSPKKP